MKLDKTSLNSTQSINIKLDKTSLNSTQSKHKTR